MAHLARRDVPVVEGPVPRAGATGPLLRVHVRDRDGTLVEISTRRASDGAAADQSASVVPFAAATMSDSMGT